MNKLILTASVLALCLVPTIGCNKKETPPQQMVEFPVEKPGDPKVQPTPPKKDAPAPIPQRPSSTWMKGYWDGFHGTWLAPIRYTFMDEYRQGRMQGVYDREHGINRYPPEMR